MKLESDYKRLSVNRWNGSEWKVYEKHSTYWDCDYKWTFADYHGNPDELGTGITEINSKFIYIDGSLINTKKQFNLEVTKKASIT